MSHMKMEDKLEIDNLLTVKQAIEELGISRATLYRWIDKNRLRPIKLGHARTTFFKRDDITVLKQHGKQQHLAM